MLLRRTLLSGLPAIAIAPALVIRRAQAAIGPRTVKIAGVLVTDLGTPLCATTNGVPKIPRGQGGYFSKVKADDPANGLTDPWDSFPSITGTYSALVGTPSVPATAVYQYSAPQKSLVYIWGSPDPGNHLRLANGETVVAFLDGGEIAGKFGYRDGIYLMIEPPRPFLEAKLVAYNRAYEWANFLNGAC